MKISNNLEQIKGVVSTYGWTYHQTQNVVDVSKVPNHICEDFDDDCYDLPQTHWSCWEHDSECGMCPFLLIEVTEKIKEITNERGVGKDKRISKKVSK